MDSSRSSTITGIIGVLGLIVAVSSLATNRLQPQWAYSIIIVSTIVLGMAMWWGFSPTSFTRVLTVIRHFTESYPVHFVLLLLIFGSAMFSLLMLLRVEDLMNYKQIVPITLEDGDVYNAADDYPEIYLDGGRVKAIKESWDCPGTLGAKKCISFTAEKGKGEITTPAESAGAYLTFYDMPIDFSKYQAVTFSIKGESDSGIANMDIGVRLVTDDPCIAGRHKEVVIRELPSLKRIGYNIQDYWEVVTIDFGEFTILPFRKPLGKIDPNRINKIVFFVNNSMVDKCPSETIWIKDIYFMK